MSLKQVGERYASTLLNLAKEKGVEDKVRSNMDILSESLKVRELSSALSSPIIDDAKKKSILKAIFDSKVEPMTINFLGLMIDKGREQAIGEAISSYISLYNADKNIKRVKITTASKLEESDFEKLKNRIKEKYFSNCELEIIHDIDEQLIGGFVLEFDDQLLDASIKNGLKKLSLKYSN